MARSRKSNTPAFPDTYSTIQTGQSPVKASVFAEMKARRTRDGGWLASSSAAFRVTSAWSRFLAALALSSAEASGQVALSRHHFHHPGLGAVSVTLAAAGAAAGAAADGL